MVYKKAPLYKKIKFKIKINKKLPFNLLQQHPLYVTTTPPFCYNSTPYVLQQLPLSVTTAPLMCYNNSPYSVFYSFIYALLRTPKRYKNIIKDIKVFYNIF